MSLTKAPTLFKCPICGKEYSKRPSLRRHRETHSGKLHECDQCEKKYNRRGTLLAHKRMAHEEPGQYECDECGRLCAHKKALLDHKRGVHDRFKCPICGKKPRPENLSRHIETHSGQPCECDKCGKVCRNSPALAAHKRHRHSEAKHRCEYCGKTFVFASGLRQHVAVHHEKREEYRCTRCPRKFKSLLGRKIHVRAEHSGNIQSFLQTYPIAYLDSRFICDSECGLHSATRSEYLQHLRSHHAKQHPATCKCLLVDVRRAQQVAAKLGNAAFLEADGTMKCIDDDCNFATTCARQMESHKEQSHHNAYHPVLRCSVCQTWFSDPSHLKRHNADKHQGERRFKCDGCGYITNDKDSFTKHQTSCQQGKVETQLQLIDEAFKHLMACCLAPMTTGLTAAAVQEAPAVKKASAEPFEALVAACLKKQASAHRSQQAPISTGMSSLFSTAQASTHHGQPTANTAASSLSSAPDGSHQQPSMPTGMSSFLLTACPCPTTGSVQHPCHKRINDNP
ncbi:zinc finger protein [Aphelenchoides avenae]|nr:zinc finger protein [Aphelenchus avenae]